MEAVVMASPVRIISSLSCGGRSCQHRLDLEELVEAEGAELPPDSGALVAAERGPDVVPGPGAVDLHLPGPQAGADPPGVVGIRRPDSGAESVRRVVGQGDRLVLVAIREEDEHRPEDLLAAHG